jgi:hypothetical protein
MGGRGCNLSGASRGVNFYLASQMPQFAGKNPALIASTTKIIEDQPQQWSAVVKNLGMPATP